MSGDVILSALSLLLPSCIWCHCLPLDWRAGHWISQSLFSPERESRILEVIKYYGSSITKT